MPSISKIQIEDETYELKDTELRERIKAIIGEVNSASSETEE